MPTMLSDTKMIVEDVTRLASSRSSLSSYPCDELMPVTTTAHDDDLEALLGQTGEEGGARADGVQREDEIRQSGTVVTARRWSRSDSSTYSTVTSARMMSSPSKPATRPGLPAEEVAAHDGAHAQRPQVRRLMYRAESAVAPFTLSDMPIMNESGLEQRGGSE
ncbi:uncharacterized protein IUM83_18951 [Phytophthora cinnamomi]|uniref:uncharacterized protein n=1 Tax=Phytophthora cinnamomi TaxID=4785 RepID=UPI003559CFE2|nr:hypothetical protein IUM83_18951 [Phytophthora cinnamomi]